MSDIEKLRQEAEAALQRYANALTDATQQPVSDIHISLLTAVGSNYARVLLEGASVRKPCGPY